MLGQGAQTPRGSIYVCLEVKYRVGATDVSRRECDIRVYVRSGKTAVHVTRFNIYGSRGQVSCWGYRCKQAAHKPNNGLLMTPKSDFYKVLSFFGIVIFLTILIFYNVYKVFFRDLQRFGYPIC